MCFGGGLRTSQGGGITIRLQDKYEERNTGIRVACVECTSLAVVYSADGCLVSLSSLVVGAEVIGFKNHMVDHGTWVI